MNCIVTFYVGLITGAIIGILLMSVLHMARDGDPATRDEEMSRDPG